MSHDTHEQATYHIEISRVTHTNEPCHTYQWVMSHTWMSHDTHINESCHAHQCVMSHVAARHVTHMNESCRTCGTHTKVVRIYHIYVTYILNIHITHICHIHITYTHHTYVWHMYEHVWRMYEYSYVWHTYKYVTLHEWMPHVTHMNESFLRYWWVMSRTVAHSLLSVSVSVRVYVYARVSRRGDIWRDATAKRAGAWKSIANASRYSENVNHRKYALCYIICAQKE